MIEGSSSLPVCEMRNAITHAGPKPRRSFEVQTGDDLRDAARVILSSR